MKFRVLPLSMAIAGIFSSAVYADNATEKMPQSKELSKISVQAASQKRAVNAQITREKLNNEMIQSNRDLVRYNVDVGVGDQGRHSKGFSIRGVEDNRVGISIDGVSLPDSEENSLYKRYGNLNTSRQSIDPELARVVEVSKGADSFNRGSGNLGGGVNYQTLQARDIVLGDNRFGLMLRSGYASRNREWVNTMGVAYWGEQADAMVLYTRRHGHEMKSAGGYTLPEDSLQTREFGYGKQTPDSSTHDHHGYLAKWAYRFAPEHRVGISFSGQNNKNHIIEDSALTLPSQWRKADDRSKRATGNIFYEYTPDSAWLALIRADLDYQKSKVSAHNYEGRRKDEYRKEDEPTDTNIRFFDTDYQRFGLRADSQPLNLGNTRHELSLRGALSERNFSVLHQDLYYLNNKWTKPVYSTMMHPVKSHHHYVSLNDQITFNPIFSGSLGVRYDWAKHSQQDLNGLECRNCMKADDARFKQFTWTLGLNAKLNSAWRLSYNIGTGFRIPNASEMYFDYRGNAAGAWMSNPNLQAERSLSQTLSLLGKGAVGDLGIHLHHTRYKDFLYEQEVMEDFHGRPRPVQQMQNTDSAKVSGLEITGRWNLNSVLPISEGWKLFGSAGYSRGSMSNGGDLLSIQPPKVVLGLDYEQPEGKWGIFSRLTYLGAKKAKDAEYIKPDTDNCLEKTKVANPHYPWFGPEYAELCTKFPNKTETWKHLNKKAFVFDVFGFYKPNQHLTLRAGVYNIFDRKYHTWDTLRGLNDTGGIVNSVGRRPNYKYGGYPGLERYYEPGRNVSVSVEYKF